MVENIESKNKKSTKPSLPLSWINSENESKISAIKIGRKSLWLNGGNFQNVDSFLYSIKNISSEKKVIIRGCNKLTSNKLVENGFNKVLFAQEAIIELNKKIPIPDKLKRRIKSLLNRGKVKEIIHGDKNLQLFNEFLKLTVNWNKPQLQNLFIDKFNTNTRLFVYEIIPNNWEGALLISQNSNEKMQGEQFFRKKNGMNGVIDTLILGISAILKTEGYSEFSLGEVPFVIDKNYHLFSKENILKLIGRKIDFAYNYKGLYNFKNKFATRWDDIFICTNNKLKLINLYGIAKKSNLIALALYKIFN